jgi:hypothetical protein
VLTEGALPLSMMANFKPLGRLSPAWPNIAMRGLLLADMDVRAICRQKRPDARGNDGDRALPASLNMDFPLVKPLGR